MKSLSTRISLLAGTALAVTALPPAQAHAAEADDSNVIVVTAQKREQDVQDVPIAVTALGGETLQANRVQTVADLGGLAPGVTVRTVAGGTALPGFTIRGASSISSVAGADKQISIYLDGVYLSASRGGIFDLPDLERIEVLRGPQGTLFGRNATAGAVSVITREPDGELGARVEGTIGNYGHYRIRASIDLPQMGPFSGYISYVHNYKRGDLKNVAAGQVWDRTASPDSVVAKRETSPKHLGTKDSDTIFAAVKFESGDFKTVYKFDWAKSKGSPEGTALVALNPNSGALGAFLNALITSQPFTVPIAANGKRPKSVANSFVIPASQKNYGHSLTSTYEVSDSLSIKNVFAYRKSLIYATSAIDGLSGLTLTAQAAPFFGLPSFLVGSQFLVVSTTQIYRSKQWSDELQINYDSDLATITAGALWFKSDDDTNTHGYQPALSFRPIIGGVIPLGNQTEPHNKATSIAAYAQIEFHVTPELDVVGGARITRDKKSGRFIIGTAPNFTVRSFSYKDTRPNFLIGVNYKPNDDILVYGKFSTAFVSGGSVAGFDFDPEKAKSVEGGVKANLFDRKVQANLAVYWAQYKNFQAPQSATLLDEVPNEIGSFIISAGTIKTKGFEFDLTAAPARGLTVGGSLGYSDTDISDVDPILLSASAGTYLLTYRPKWTGALWGQYNTDPLFGEAFASFRLDASWQSKSLQDSNPARSIGWAPDFPYLDPYWVVNGRVSLRDVGIGGAKAEVGFWVKNLNNARASTFALNLFNTLATANFIPARTYGIDLILEY
jgi:iron complex outermembrane receptor protein